MGSGSGRAGRRPVVVRPVSAVIDSQARVARSLPPIRPVSPLRPPATEAPGRGTRQAARTPIRTSLPRLPEPPNSPGPSAGAPMSVQYSPLSRRLDVARHPGSPDYWLIVAVMALLLLGLVMVDSASQFSAPADPGYWFDHQLVWALLGGSVLVGTLRVDYHRWRLVALPGMLVGLALLLAVLVAGSTISGAQRWLSLGIFSIQPSELVKLLLVIYLAHWLIRKRAVIESLSSGLVPFILLVGTVLVLILLQNDVGTSIIVALVALAMFYSAGGRCGHLLAVLACGTLAYLVIILATSFRRARFEAFLNPLPSGCGDASSYQVCQGLISLGSGGLTGRGLGGSIQKAGYLPNPFTDGIFAVLGEELGLLGCAVVVFLFVVIAYRGLRIARSAPDSFGSLLACGITCWIVVQAAVNIGSVIDLIPFTGVPLPFVSFGGSSLIATLAAVGILLNVSRYRGIMSRG